MRKTQEKFLFSPSSLNLLKDCPRCFWLQFNKAIKRPAGIFPSLPSGMDHVLKTHFDRYIGKGLPSELKNLEGVELFSDKAQLDLWRSNFKGIRLETPAYTLRGAVDNLLVKGKKLIVLDYKTRGFPLKEDTHHHAEDQMHLYNFLLRKNGHATEDYSYLLFYHPKEVLENGDVVFNKDLIKIPVDIKRAKTILKTAVKTLKAKCPKKSCDWCQSHTSRPKPK